VADHLRPSAPIYADALLPGDPGRALALAQDLMARPRMANHARGLWGYSGNTADGRELTIQSTGLGGPSIAVVLSELAALGVTRAIRIGSCTALDPRLGPGAMLVAGKALGERVADGSSSSEPDAVLSKKLVAELGVAGSTAVATTDAYYDPEWERRSARWSEAGATAVDLGTAAVFAVGTRLGLAVASALVVSRGADGTRLGDDELEAASLKAGRAAAAALAG
jgi:uridine phosphorylase